MPDQDAAQTATLDVAADQQDAADTDRFAAKLQQDARSWSARDDDARDRAADAALTLGVQQVKAAATATRKRSKAAPKAAAPIADTKDKPFSMSYEGVTNAQYIAGRIARGAR